MKQAFLFTLLSLISFSVLAIDKSSIIRIEVGNSSGSTSTSDLQMRVWMLEKAIAQLQTQVFQLETNANTPKIAQKMFTCTLETPFDGTFTSTKPSAGEARGDVLKQCSDKKISSIYCEKRKVECED